MEKVRKIMALLVVMLVILTSLYFYQGSMLSQESGVYAGVEETSDDVTIDTGSSTSTVLVYNNYTNNGDPWFNASNASKITQAWMDIWNQTGGSGGLNMSNITNSNNNEWPVTEGNLENAINDVGTTGWVCIGSDLTTTYEINMSGHDGVHLIFLFNVVTLSGDISFINFTNCNFGGLWNVFIKVSTQTGSIIKGYSHSDASRCDYVTLSNIWIENTGGTYGSSPWSYTEHNFTGIELFADDVGATGRIFEWYISNVVIEGADVGVLIKTSGAGYVNGCDFYHVYTEQPVTAIEFVEISSTNGANSNNFYSFRTQTATYSEYGFKNIQGSNTGIYSSLPWDWSESLVPVYAIWIGIGGVNTKIEVDSKDMVDSILDDGLGSSIKCGNRELYYDADYDYKFTTNGTHYFCRTGLYGDRPVSGTLDGGTDFEAMMESVLDEGNITIRLDNGTFIIDDEMAITGYNITVIGREDMTTIIKATDGASYLNGMFTMFGTASHNITFKYIVFDGTGSVLGSAIRFGANNDMFNLVVEYCEFHNFYVEVGGTNVNSSAILVRQTSDDTATNIRIQYCEFYNCLYGISFDGDNDPSLVINFDISHNYLSNNLYGIYCDYARNGSISNNRIISNVASSDGITLDDSIDIIVDGNNIIVADDGIIEVATANYNMIYGNNLRHSGDPLTTVGANTNSTLNIV